MSSNPSLIHSGGADFEHAEEAGVPRARFICAIAVGQFGSAINTVALIMVCFPLTVAALDPVNKVTWLGAVTGTHALVSLVAAPVFGVLSDRCTSRFGRRRPFIAAGAIVTCVAMLIMGAAPTMGWLVAGAALDAVGNGLFVGGFAAVVPEHVSESYRGRMMGVIAAVTLTAGVVASVALPPLIDNQLLMFGLPGVVGLLCAAVLVVLLKDGVRGPDEMPIKTGLSGWIANFRIRPREMPDFTWAWCSRFLVALGTALTSLYGVYYLTDSLNVSQADLPPLVTMTGLVGLITAVVGAGLGATISDRWRVRKKLVLVSTASIFAGACTVAFAPTVSVYFIGMVLTGLGAGMYMPVSGALSIDVLPDGGREPGKYMGLASLADSVPRTIGPVFAPVLVSLGALTALGGYPLVYLTGGVIAVAGGLLVRRIQISV